MEEEYSRLKHYGNIVSFYYEKNKELKWWEFRKKWALREKWALASDLLKIENDMYWESRKEIHRNN